MHRRLLLESGIKGGYFMKLPEYLKSTYLTYEKIEKIPEETLKRFEYQVKDLGFDKGFPYQISLSNLLDRCSILPSYYRQDGTPRMCTSGIPSDRLKNANIIAFGTSYAIDKISNKKLIAGDINTIIGENIGDITDIFEMFTTNRILLFGYYHY